MLYPNILATIGKTPLVKFNRFAANLACNFYGKCEFFNPGGSIKDRIAINMIENAERAGKIKPGDTLIEPTSGNTGIGIALAAAVKGYKVIITMPEKMSREKQVILEALGAHIIRTPNEAAWDDPESHIGIAIKLSRELPNAYILDQYANPSNPDAHYEGTAEEILNDLDGKVDMVVMGAGTGGTITGIARKIKQVCPKAIIVGADPVGSILGGGDHIASYLVEGIGYDFIPKVLDRDLVDTWVKTRDQSSFLLARRLVLEEGILVGGSSGSALYAALDQAKKLKAGQNCVVILPDGVRNYLSKFVDDKWMREHQFTYLNEASHATVRDILGERVNKTLYTLEISSSIADAVNLLRKHNISQIPIVENEKLCGIVSENDLLNFLSMGLDVHGIIVGSVMNRLIPTVELNTPMSTLTEVISQHECTVVVDGAMKPLNILTKIDLVEWLSHGSKHGNKS